MARALQILGPRLGDVKRSIPRRGPRRRPFRRAMDGGRRGRDTESPTIRKIERMHDSPTSAPVEIFKSWLQIDAHCGMLCAVSAIGVAIGREHRPGKGGLSWSV